MCRCGKAREGGSSPAAIESRRKRTEARLLVDLSLNAALRNSSPNKNYSDVYFESVIFNRPGNLLRTVVFLFSSP